MNDIRVILSVYVQSTRKNKFLDKKERKTEREKRRKYNKKLNDLIVSKWYRDLISKVFI